MRVLLITNRYPAGPDDPASPFVPHFARALADTGVSVDVLTPQYGTSEVDRGPVHVQRFDTGATAPIGSWNYLSPFSWLRLERFLAGGLAKGRQLCAENTYDHILALWALPSGHFAQRLAREFNIPYSVWCLGSDIYTWAERPFFRGRIERVLKGARCVFADGDDLCKRIHRWLGIDAHFLPSFRPLEGLGGIEPPKPTDTPRFLYLGRLHRAKGVYELLEAFRTVRKTLPQASLTFVGGGPALEELTERVVAAGLSESVHLLGAVRNEDIVAHLTASDIVVLPTRSDSIPLVLTEAVQAMRSVIGTDVGDLGRTIREYRLGHVTQSLEPSVLASTMVEAAESPNFDPEGSRLLLETMRPERAARAFLEHVSRPDKQQQSSQIPATSPREAAYSE